MTIGQLQRLSALADWLRKEAHDCEYGAVCTAMGHPQAMQALMRSRASILRCFEEAVRAAMEGQATKASVPTGWTRVPVEPLEAMEKVLACAGAAPVEAKEEASDWQHLKRFGYAPGNYMSRCHRCKATATDVDKRAVTCRPCAESMHDGAARTPLFGTAGLKDCDMLNEHCTPAEAKEERTVADKLKGAFDVFAEVAATPQPQAGQPISWEDIAKAIIVMGSEAARRGAMFPQTSDEQAEDRRAERRVCEELAFYREALYSKIGWPKMVASLLTSEKWAHFQARLTTIHGMAEGQVARELFDLAKECAALRPTQED